ncbi:hypothetical protein [Parasitella parasitica]|uniref:C2H2-type domain-containing protein n=1 Tax=Parasitella parasitica TaxID=35722 RepID=A0A0B7N357_9FUNG|nr:hypothetical protein [Parasitella parasitica]
MSSSCVQQSYQDPLTHDGQDMRFVDPNSISQQQQQQHPGSYPYDYSQFIKKQQQQQQQQQNPHHRRFSYASMLSDADQCYLPTITNSSPSNDSDDYTQHETPPNSSSVVSPASVSNFIDPVYVDLQTKGLNQHQAGMFHHGQQHPHMLMDHRSAHHQPIQYYDPHHKGFGQNNNMFNHHRNNSIIPAQHQGFPISSLCTTPTPTSATLMNKHNQSRPMTPVSPPLLVKDNYAGQQDQKSSAINNNLETSAKPKKTPRSRGRRVSNVPGCGTRMFTCKADGCGKVFKRSEHLKRHIRSIHTLEKPFECPYQSCNKRFSRSDNLNQHIRIHRHSNASKDGVSTQKASKHIKLEGAASSSLSSIAAPDSLQLHHQQHPHQQNHFNAATNNSNNSTFSNFI